VARGIDRARLGAWLLSAVTLAVSWPLASRSAQAQADPQLAKIVQVTRATRIPSIDGVIAADEWSDAAVVDDLHQVRPLEFSAPSERTRVLVMYDADTLYVAARMSERRAEDITANILLQNEDLETEDTFAVVLDTFNDSRGGYWFEVNPHGVRRQGFYQNVTELNEDWRGIWRAMGRRDAQGWVAEMAIPMKTLSFDPVGNSWGINFQRRVQRRGETIAWVSRNREVNPGAVGQALGLSGLKQGVGLDAAPSLSVRHERSFGPRTDTSSVEPSLDLFYSITPALTAAVTLNTDFSATEVDERALNFTRFDLFLPERRAFFLQGADIFEFAHLTSRGNDREIPRASLENGRPFFSRRIGLSGSGDPVDLRAGARVTGRSGRWSIGLLDVQQEGYDSVDSRNLFVGRTVVNVLTESSLGAIVTHGDPRSNLSNTVVGADFRYRNTRLPGDNVLDAETWLQRSKTEGVNGNDAAYGFGLRMPNQSGLRVGLGLKILEENFYPALGFLIDSGIREYTAELRYTHLSDGALRRVFAAADVQRVELIEGERLQSQSIVLRPLVLETREGYGLALTYFDNREVLHEDFEISTGVVLPSGDYAFEEYKITLDSPTHRKLVGSIRAAHGDFYSGERLNLEFEGNWRPSPHFNLTFEYEWFDIDLPQGSFITRLLRLRSDVVLSSMLSWSTLFQYDSDSELAGVNSRVAWTPEAGREAYFIVNYGREDFDRDGRFRSLATDVALKLGYIVRF
jgi:hypothetical protein